MEESDLIFFENLLNQQLNELMEMANMTVDEIRSSSMEASDLIDKATLHIDYSFKLRIRDRESRLIKKIIQALDRIDDGTYGICDMCGEDISIERLKARPVTSFCIQCKNRSESLEKAFG
ncbi:MAG: RNA polymerase-binding protein DksA [Desulfobacterales bacterium]|nr:RNA polymerase-binding protein DksA [Desulfobacterales bacterium]